MAYDFKDIEKKWQDKWESEKTYRAINCDETRKKFYVLVEFPYPSGSGLHVGHTPSQIGMDIVARKKRAEGYNVLYPIGFDAFGLPTEQYAIKTKQRPQDVTEKNVEYFKKQIKSIGISFDWDRCFSTTDESYYKWTQWLFLQFYKHGLAYKQKANINWCPNCKIGLSNEESEGGVCERCGTTVVQKSKEQWMLKMSAYSEKLLQGLDQTHFPDSIKQSQKNWIGKSEGVKVKFATNVGDDIEIFTTCIETIFGVTFVVLAPENSLVQKWRDKITNFDDVKSYIDATNKKTEFERGELSKGKSGCLLEGIFAINPVNNKPVSVYIADFVLNGYGTGAVMAVPCHDQRDFEFAKLFNIPKIEVISGGETQSKAFEKLDYLGKGCKLENSGEFNNLTVEQAKVAITDKLVGLNVASKQVNYKMRDWVFSRQRYWGEPVPMIHCDKCGWVPVPEKDLPVRLPNVAHYEPTDDGESPLSNIDSFVNTICPVCGGKAKRETDVMPNWAGSSWYYLRYMDSHNDKQFASPEAMKYWGMVDMYNGGGEHVTRHLLYARFWHKFFYDIGLVPYSEPFDRRIQQGLILASDGSKMSKSKGNTIDPMKYIEQYGADVSRLSQMFMGDYCSTKPWSDDCIRPCQKLLERIWNYQQKLVVGEVTKNSKYNIACAVKDLTEDIDSLKFNTGISVLMVLANYFDTQANITTEEYKIMLKLLCPYAPHLANEIWKMQNFDGSVEQNWPRFSQSDLKQSETEIVVQQNSKIKRRLNIPTDSTAEQVKQIVLSTDFGKVIDQTLIKKVIYIPNKLINFIM